MDFRSSRAAVAAMALLALLPNLGLIGVVQAAEVCESNGLRYDCVTEEVRRRSIPLFYTADGLTFEGEDNGSVATSVFDTWPSTISFVQVPPDFGARIGAGRETTILAYHLNSTGSQFAVTPSTTLTNVWESTGRPAVTITNLLPTARYVLNGSSQDIMNGASSFLYRGITNITSDIALHAVEIKNKTGSVVFRTATFDNDEAEIINGRAYYRMSLPFRSGEDYTFTEYVKYVTPTNPVNAIELWVSPFEVAALGAETFIAYPDDAVQTSVSMPPAYSFIFLEGLGPAGVESLVIGDDTLNVTRIRFFVRGTESADPSHVKILIPLRHTRPLDFNVTISADRSDTGDRLELAQNWNWYHNVTGSLIVDFGLDQTADAGYNRYVVDVQVNLSGNDSLAYNKFPIEQDWSDDALATELLTARVGHTVSQLTPSGSIIVDRWYVWISHAEILTEDNATVVQQGGETPHQLLTKTVALGIFVFQYLPFTNVLIPAVGWLGGESFTGAGACRAINKAALNSFEPGTVVENPHGLVCDEAFLKKLNDGATRVVTGLACGLAATGAVATAFTKSVPIAIGTIVAGVVCGIGINEILKDMGIDIFEILLKALERLGQWISTFLDVAGPIIMLVLFLMASIMLLYSVCIAIKYILLAFLSVLFPFTGGKYKRPRNWAPFNKVYSWYLFGYSDLVERRIFKMDVHA